MSSFALDEAALLSVGGNLRSLQRELGGRVLSLNVPDRAPPELPRAVLKLSDALVNVCLDRFQVSTRPPKHIAGDIKQATSFARNRALPVFERLFKSDLSYEWTGVVAEFEFPHRGDILAGGHDAAGPVFDRLV